MTEQDQMTAALAQMMDQLMDMHMEQVEANRRLVEETLGLVGYHQLPLFAPY